MTKNTNDEQIFYLGLADITLKGGSRTHARDFKHQMHQNSVD